MKKLFKALAFILLLLICTFYILKKSPIPLEVLKQKYSIKSSKFIDIDGLHVHYSVEGEGKPIVLIHGTGGALQNWNIWSDSLVRNHFKVIRLDLPGFGLTGPRKEDDYSIKANIDFLDKFMTKINIDSFAIAGNSLGGQIACEYSVAHPERITKSILIDPAGYSTEEHRKKKESFLKIVNTKWLSNIIIKLNPKVFAKKSIKEGFVDVNKVPESDIEMYSNLALLDGNRACFFKSLTETAPRINIDFSAIKAPTLIQWGKQDKLIDVSIADVFTKIPNSKLIVYDNCGHSPQMEIPQLSVKDAIDFLNKN
jgi:pimeloyl-ACP methyl ester carboxylesterase